MQKKKILLISSASALLLVAGFLTFRFVFPGDLTYEECVNARGSTVLNIYPGICVTKSGAQIYEDVEITDESVLETPDPSVCEVTDCVVAIQNNKCCPCPAYVPSGLIGKGGWEEYDGTYSIQSYEPDYCSRYRHLSGECAVCPNL